MIVFDHSARNVWDTCKRKYFWTYRLKLDSGRSDAMDEGAFVHEALYHWYKTRDVNYALNAVVLERPEGMLPQEAEKYNEREWAMKELVRGYIRENADEPFDTLDGEIALAWEISEGYWFVGIADGLINDRTIGLLAHEFKRTSQIAADWIARFQIDAQTTGYVMLLRENNINAKGAVLSILRATKYPEYVRDTVITPQWLIEELEAELRNIVGELEHRIEKYAVDSTLHGAMSPQALAWWPKNTSACFQYNQACPYRKLCIETPQNREVMLAEGFFKPRRAREEGILKRALDRRRDAAHAERSSEEA